MANVTMDLIATLWYVPAGWRERICAVITRSWLLRAYRYRAFAERRNAHTAGAPECLSASSMALGVGSGHRLMSVRNGSVEPKHALRRDVWFRAVPCFHGSHVRPHRHPAWLDYAVFGPFSNIARNDQRMSGGVDRTRGWLNHAVSGARRCVQRSHADEAALLSADVLARRIAMPLAGMESPYAL